MNLQILSDIHLEFEPEKLPEINLLADVIVVAGDLSISESDSENFFKYIRSKSSAPILYVLGNHEYYGKYLMKTMGRTMYEWCWHIN